MLARVALTLLILSTSTTAMASKSAFSLQQTRTTLLAFAEGSEIAITPGTNIENSLQDRQRNGMASVSGLQFGLGIVSWMLQASFYGVCLTQGLAEIYAGDPAMTLENISRSLGVVPTAALDVPGWASDIARGLGIVYWSNAESYGESGGSLEFMFLPLGPANTAGVMVAGCYG